MKGRLVLFQKEFESSASLGPDESNIPQQCRSDPNQLCFRF